MPALTIGSDLGKRFQLLNLLETFERAEDIPGLAHQSPGALIALHDLLLGLMYETGVHPRTQEQWREWVEDRHPLDEVAKVLSGSEYDGRLDLFHPERPFGQNPALLPFLGRHGYGRRSSTSSVPVTARSSSSMSICTMSGARRPTRRWWRCWCCTATTPVAG